MTEVSGSQLNHAVNPATGEVLESLHQQPPEALAEALSAVHAYQEDLKRWGDALEAELRNRLKIRKRKLVVFGDWEVAASTTRHSEWDADQLEAAMRQLATDGTVQAGEMTAIITREPVVSRSRAKKLRDRLTGEARALVDACCTWKEKPGKLTVARSAELVPGDQHADENAALQTPSAASPPLPSTGSPAFTPINPEELFA